MNFGIHHWSWMARTKQKDIESKRSSKEKSSTKMKYIVHHGFASHTMCILLRQSIGHFMLNQTRGQQTCSQAISPLIKSFGIRLYCSVSMLNRYPEFHHKVFCLASHNPRWCPGGRNKAQPSVPSSESDWNIMHVPYDHQS